MEPLPISRKNGLSLLEFDHHPRRYAHGHEFLEQKFASVRNADFGDLSLVAAAFALEGVVAQVGDGHQAAQVAHVHRVSVGNFEKTLAKELKTEV